jgi:hypothetical protein
MVFLTTPHIHVLVLPQWGESGDKKSKWNAPQRHHEPPEPISRIGNDPADVDPSGLLAARLESWKLKYVIGHD